MFSDKVIEERKLMLIQELLLDKIACIKTKKEINKYENIKVSELEQLVKKLNYISFRSVNKKEAILIVSLLEERIDELIKENDNNSSKIIKSMVDFFIYEYRLILKDYVKSFNVYEDIELKEYSN